MHDNWDSAYRYGHVVHETLLADVEAGTKLGPFSSPPFSTYVGSPLGVFPRKRSDKYRIIHDLSWPPGQSINDFISKDDSSVEYVSFDHVAQKVHTYGRGTLLSKLDLANAYKHTLVRPEDWDLLGCTWTTRDHTGSAITEYFIDVTLPFGLRSSAKLFSEVAHALKLSMLYNGATDIEQYLDDYITFGPRASSVCSNNLTIMLDTCEYIGFKVNPQKVTNPSTVIEFLGLVIDSDKMEVRASHERVSEIMTELKTFHNRRTCTKRELLSIVGKLMFLSRAVKAGRSFVRRIIELSKKIKHLHHKVRLSRPCRDDFLWWIYFLPRWNGVALIPDNRWTSNADMELYTDASDIAIAGYFRGHWFVLEFMDQFSYLTSYDICFRELLAIVVSLATWGNSMQRKRILFHCDNMSTVYILQNGTSKNPLMMNLVRTALFISAQYNIEYSAVHISSKDNDIADSLSRLQWDRFRALAPDADTCVTTPCVVDWQSY